VKGPNLSQLSRIALPQVAGKMDEVLADHGKEVQKLQQQMKKQEERCRDLQEDKEQLSLELEQAQVVAGRLQDLSVDKDAQVARLETLLAQEQEQNEELQAELDASQRVKRLARQQAAAMQLAGTRHRQISAMA
jgi:hypothetical protein